MKSIVLTDGTTAFAYKEKSEKGVVIVLLVPGTEPDFYSAARYWYSDGGDVIFDGMSAKEADSMAEVALTSNEAKTIGTGID